MKSSPVSQAPDESRLGAQLPSQSTQGILQIWSSPLEEEAASLCSLWVGHGIRVSKGHVVEVWFPGYQWWQAVEPLSGGVLVGNEGTGVIAF